MALILHVPVIHEGYIQLFNRQKKEKTLYLLGVDLIREMPLVAREVRRVDPTIIAELIKAMNFFERVEVLTPKTIKKLNSQAVITADEEEVVGLIKKYLPGSPIGLDTAFLRWGANNINKVEPVSEDSVISNKKLDREVMAMASKEAAKSADWFRQVGAAIVADGKVLVSGYNKRQPTPHAAYTEGDPRNFVEPGTDTYLRSTLHAEQDVIARAAKDGIKINNASIYVTTFPCPDCAAVIVASGIKKCYFWDGYSSLDGEKILKQAGVQIIRVK